MCVRVILSLRVCGVRVCVCACARACVCVASGAERTCEDMQPARANRFDVGYSVQEQLDVFACMGG